MGFSSDMRVPLGSGASGQKPEEVGFAASPWGGTRYASQPKLHCGNLGRYFRVSVLSRNHQEREVGGLFGVYICCLYCTSMEMELGQSRALEQDWLSCA